MSQKTIHLECLRKKYWQTYSFFTLVFTLKHQVIEDSTWPRGDMKFFSSVEKYFTRLQTNVFQQLIYFVVRKQNKGAIYHVTSTTDIHITFYSYHVSARKLTWYFISVYISILCTY